MVHILSILSKKVRFLIDEMFQRNAKKMVTLLLDTKNLKEFEAFGRNISLSTKQFFLKGVVYFCGSILYIVYIGYLTSYNVTRITA